jgi:hypothetical protein
LFTINARGDAQVLGAIIVKDNNLAGSKITNGQGEADVVFSYPLGTGKPDVQLTVEGGTPALAQVLSWTKDENQNYTGFKIKTFNLSGEAISVNVHYLVIGKQDGYVSDESALNVVNSNSSGSVVPPNTDLSGGEVPEGDIPVGTEVGPSHSGDDEEDEAVIEESAPPEEESPPIEEPPPVEE